MKTPYFDGDYACLMGQTAHVSTRPRNKFLWAILPTRLTTFTRVNLAELSVGLRLESQNKNHPFQDGSCFGSRKQTAHIFGVAKNTFLLRRARNKFLRASSLHRTNNLARAMLGRL